MFEHKHMVKEGFTRRYLIDRLVNYEVAPDILSAIAREKQIKGWLRAKKVELVESRNPGWQDLSTEWFRERTAETLRSAQGDAQPP